MIRRWRQLQCVSVAVVVATVLATAGCTVGPNYRKPDVTVPAQWSSPTTAPATSAPATTQPVDLAHWWASLNDPTLDSLIERAVSSNLDLRMAEARVREARAQRGIVAADLWPQVSGGGGYTYRGDSLNARSHAEGASAGWKNQAIGTAVRAVGGQIVGAGGGSIAQTAVEALGSGISNASRANVGQLPRSTNLFQAGFDASWEIDVFGGVRRAVEAAEADIQAAEEDRRDVLVTLLAEVARNYVELRSVQRRLEIAAENIAVQADTVELTRTLAAAGLTSDLDVAQAEAQLASTRSQVPVLETLQRQIMHQLGVLLAQSPASLVEELSRPGSLPPTPMEVPAGVPSDLLRRRPDIRRSEREVAAATARIGVATADLFPRFSLTGSFGVQTQDVRHMLDSKSLFGTVGPSVSWPIFEGGRIRANIEVQNAREAQALAFYGRSVLTALAEVEDALVAYTQERVRYEHLTEAVRANRQAADLAHERYSKGIESFLVVLESERSLYASEDALVISQGQAVNDLIAVYKALGGGWAEAPSQE